MINSIQQKVNSRIFLFYLAIPVVSLLMHIRIFNKDLIGIHVWRQAQTQINIQNFYREDFYILNPKNNNLSFSQDRIMRYEFPIMQWSIAGIHKLFGESIIITRICMFLIGLWGCFGFFCLIRWIWEDNIVALFATYAFSFSPVFYYYTMNPIPDVFALSASMWFLAFFLRYLKSCRNSDAVLSAIFLSLSAAAKLPYLMFGSMVGIFVLRNLLNRQSVSFKRALIVSIVFTVILFPPLLWYKIVIPTWGNNGVLAGVFDNQVPLSRTIEIFKFHFTDLLPRLLLNYGVVPLFVASLFGVFAYKVYNKKFFWEFFSIGIMPLIYFFMEYNMIDVIHDYYMMPFLPPLFIVIAFGIRKALSLHRFLTYFVLMTMLTLPFFSFRTVNHFWGVEQSYFNPDILNSRLDLRRVVPNEEPCIMLNDISPFIFSYMVDKKGYVFSNDVLPVEWIDDIVNNKGVKYMYSDSRKVDENPAVKPYLEKILLERGSVRVFKLRRTK